MTMTTLSLWQGHNTAYLLAVGCESSGSQVLWNRWSNWRFLSLVYLATYRWSYWRRKPSGQSIANVYAPIGGVLNIVRLSISYCLPIHILFSRIKNLIDIRVKSIITFFEIIYHHNNSNNYFNK